MAKTKHALFSLSARGKIGPVVIEQRREGQYIKTKRLKIKKPTPKQLSKRQRYGQAVQTWQQLPPDLKEVFNIKAKLKQMSGFNLFLKYFTTYPQIAIYGVGIYGVNNYG